MKKLPEEKARDHEHHRSLWLTHGDVNGENFWAETPGTGKIVHREFVDVAGGDTARIVTRNDWIAHDGKKVCEDQRTFVFAQLAINGSLTLRRSSPRVRGR